MSGVTVKFFDDEDDRQTMNHMDGGGCVWCIEVGESGSLWVYQEPDGASDVRPIVLANHFYAPGTWRTAVRQ